MRERVRLSALPGNGPFGMISRGRIGEFSDQNTPIINLKRKFGAYLGVAPDTIILEINALTDSFRRPHTPDTIRSLGVPYASHGILCLTSVFIGNWSSEDGIQQISASFTQAISTFTGETIIRIQFTTSGLLPVHEKLIDVISALVVVGHSELLAREWQTSGRLDNNDRALIMRFHALDEPRIVEALKQLGAHPRMIGNHTMLPVITAHANTPYDVLLFDTPAASRLDTSNCAVRIAN
jgi:hypothetical protein